MSSAIKPGSGLQATAELDAAILAAISNRVSVEFTAAGPNAVSVVLQRRGFSSKVYVGAPRSLMFTSNGLPYVSGEPMPAAVAFDDMPAVIREAARELAGADWKDAA